MSIPHGNQAAGQITRSITHSIFRGIRRPGRNPGERGSHREKLLDPRIQFTSDEFASLFREFAHADAHDYAVHQAADDAFILALSASGTHQIFVP